MTNNQMLKKYINDDGEINVDGLNSLSAAEQIATIKDLFNVYFKDHLYGKYRSKDNVIVSSGSVDHTIFSIPSALKYFINYALKSDWYGYSDSLGRTESRKAISDYENALLGASTYSLDNICINIGATHCLSSLFAYISKYYCTEHKLKSPAICALPGYPPHVKSLSENFEVDLVNLNFKNDVINIDEVIRRVKPDTPVIFLQTVINPIGKKISDVSLNKLISMVSPRTLIILDECHDCFGKKTTVEKKFITRSNIIRVKSLSKEFLAPGIRSGWFIASSEFTKNFYEFASTNYSSPPSLLYLLIEGLAIFEKWRLTKKKKYKDFGKYNISTNKIGSLYNEYIETSKNNFQRIIANRNYCVNYLENAGIEVIKPDYSINVAFRISESFDSYKAFLSLLKKEKLSVYPCILNFIYEKGWVRISPNIDSTKLQKCLEGMVNYFNKNKREKIEQEIGSDFRQSIPEIFGDNLEFAFVCGGIAKGYWDQNHDIDVFVCTKKVVSKEVAIRYYEWYINLHERYGFCLDRDCPGEIVNIGKLKNTLKIMKNHNLKTNVTNMKEKEAIIWLDILIGKKLGFIGNSRFVNQLKKEYGNIYQVWKQSILDQLTPDEKLLWKDKSYLLIMERFMCYPDEDKGAFHRTYLQKES